MRQRPVHRWQALWLLGRWGVRWLLGRWGVRWLLGRWGVRWLLLGHCFSRYISTCLLFGHCFSHYSCIGIACRLIGLALPLSLWCSSLDTSSAIYHKALCFLGDRLLLAAPKVQI